MYYDSTANLLYYNTGTAATPVWTAVGTSAAANMDASYDAFGAAAALINVDGGAGQTTGLEFALTNSQDMMVDIGSAASEFIIQDGGTNSWVWDSDALLDITDTAGAGDIFDITRNAVSTGDVFDIDMGTGLTVGDGIDISWSGAGVGDAISVNMDNNLAGGAFVVTDGSGVRTDALIDVTTDSTAGDVANFVITGATSGHGINLDYSAIATGNGLDITYGTAAATGNAVDLNMGTNLAGNALNLNLTGARTGAGIVVDDDSTGSAPALDMNFSGIRTGNAIDVTYATAAATENAVDLNMGTNVAGDALNINTAATGGNAIDVTASGIFTAELIDINTTAAWTGNLMDVDVASTPSGNVLDVTYSGVATGNTVDLNMATNVAGDAININTAATTGHALVVSASGVFTDSLIDLDSTAGIWTGNMVEASTGGNAATGDVMNVNIEANDVAAQAFVVDNDAASSVAGWLMDVEIDGVAAAAAIDIVDSVARTGDIFSYDNDGNAVWTGDIFQITTGTGDASGDVMNVAIEGGATDVQVLTVNNDATSDQAGWLVNVDSSAVFTAAMIQFDDTGNVAWSGNLIDVNTGTGDSSGDIMNVNIEAGSTDNQVLVVDNDAASDQAGWLIDLEIDGVASAAAIDIVDSVARTGDIFSYDNDGNVAWTGDIFQITSGTGDASGDIMNVQFEAGATDIQMLTLNNDAATDQAGWAYAIDASGAWTANAFNFDQSAGISTADVFAYDNSGNTAVTGDFISYASGTGDVDGDVMDITVELGATSAQIFDVNNAAVSDEAGWLMEVDTTGAWTGNMIDITTGAQAVTGNFLDINIGNAAATGDVININHPALAVAMNDIVIDNAAIFTSPSIDLNMSAAHTAAVIDVADAGVGAANVGSTLNVAHTGTLANADASVMRITTNSASSAASSLVDLSSTGNLAAAGADGAVLKITETGAAQATTYAMYIASTNNEALRVDTGLVLFDEGGTTGPLNYAADGGAAADVYTMTLVPALPAYAAGQMFIMTAANANNTGACTLNVNALGAKNIKVNPVGGGALADPAADDIDAQGTNLFVYDGTNMILINPSTTTGE
jgi:hypothetical protein